MNQRFIKFPLRKQMSTLRTSKRVINARAKNNKRVVYQIFYESLILAQDERWRRA